ncbi:hypothetical protein DdX_05975 [Ditylenchus destructor]|uniref:Uncharacterized protein n=1 Tax=Ditylenchus destructor TaxID=166010 RepID=A0AAD4NBM1_9BILA|nr:hypothetical protein DdX_05975 [Ditylenchus destructor]
MEGYYGIGMIGLFCVGMVLIALLVLLGLRHTYLRRFQRNFDRHLSSSHLSAVIVTPTVTKDQNSNSEINSKVQEYLASLSVENCAKQAIFQDIQPPPYEEGIFPPPPYNNTFEDIAIDSAKIKYAKA